VPQRPVSAEPAVDTAPAMLWRRCPSGDVEACDAARMWACRPLAPVGLRACAATKLLKPPLPLRPPRPSARGGVASSPAAAPPEPPGESAALSGASARACSPVPLLPALSWALPSVAVRSLLPGCSRVRPLGGPPVLAPLPAAPATATGTAAAPESAPPPASSRGLRCAAAGAPSCELDTPAAAAAAASGEAGRARKPSPSAPPPSCVRRSRMADAGPAAAAGVVATGRVPTSGSAERLCAELPTSADSGGTDALALRRRAAG